MAGGPPLPRAWYRRDPLEVAPELLGATLVAPDGRAARLVEVEAYRGADDPGSHAFRGRTPRTAVMWGPPGHLYVYFTYGMHWCANVVCADDGVAGAVLLRAAEVVAGEAAVRRSIAAAARPGRPDGPRRDLCRGPARLCRAFGLDGSADGADVVAGRMPSGAPGPILVGTDAGGAGGPVATGPRVGLAPGRGEDHPWRWWLEGHPAVTAWRPGGRRRVRAVPEG